VPLAEAVVMAAGEGLRLRPITERWPKPVLPIDGRPVIATLLRELAGAGLRRAIVVTGHLAQQVERLVGDGSAFGIELRHVRQPRPDGSADAVLRAGVEPPYLVTAADTVYGAGDVGRFLAAVARSSGAGAIAVRRQPGRPHHTRIRAEGGRVVRVLDPTVPDDLTAAPLMLLGEPVAGRLSDVTRAPFRPPYELRDAFQGAIDAGHEIAAVEIGRTRDLTHPVDLVVENFPYLSERP
jgi:NDP-sugar pyrophosphorylase family protein